MGYIYRLFLGILFLFVCGHSSANMVGSPAQNFNIHHSRQDFITVQSSETLQKRNVNLVYFLDYARDTIFSTTTTVGNKKDKALFSSLSLGYGITDIWDVGLTLPYILHQELGGLGGGTGFDDKGFIDIRLSSKLKIKEWTDGGIAVIGHIGFNRSEELPFYGDKLGGSAAIELVVDKTWNQWHGALNLGYRHFNVGQRLPGFMVFDPIESAFIASLGGKYSFNERWQCIAEVWASLPKIQIHQDIDRSKQSFEMLAGGTYRHPGNFQTSFGFTTGINEGLSTPESRFFVGGSYQFGLPDSAKSKSKDTFAHAITSEEENSERLTVSENKIDPELKITSTEFVNTENQAVTVQGLNSESQTVAAQEEDSRKGTASQKVVSSEEKIALQSAELNFEKKIASEQKADVEHTPNTGQRTATDSIDESRQIANVSTDRDGLPIDASAIDHVEDALKGLDALKSTKTLKPEQRSQASSENLDDTKSSEVLVTKRVFSEEVAGDDAINGGYVPNRIYFNFDSADLRPESHQVLKDFFSELMDMSFETLTIAGHTDSVGPNVYNLYLSERRAQAVLNYLVVLGFDKVKGEIIGYGEEKPLVPNTTSKNRSKNRRVEFIIQR